MPPGGEGKRRAAAGEAGAADFPERDRRRIQRLGDAKFCRAGFASRGMVLA